MANYHRERLLGQQLASCGIAVMRFHYVGEGNSDGVRADMTFASLCENTEAVVDHGRSLGFSDFAFIGSRIGAAVAARTAASNSTTPLAMWEPVSDPRRYMTEGHRAQRMSQLAQESASEATDWRADLAEHGVTDILGYDIHREFVDSFEGVDLVSMLEGHTGPVLIARFRSAAKTRDKLADDLLAQGLAVDRVFVDVTEPWWFDRETDPDSGDLLPATAQWIESRLARGATS